MDQTVRMVWGFRVSRDAQDSCITHLKAQGPSRTCDESKEEEEDVMQGAPRVEVSFLVQCLGLR